jgi:hypothetical protein
MIETDMIDLCRDVLKIQFVDCDCPLEFPGYSVEPADSEDPDNGLVKLVKK